MKRKLVVRWLLIMVTVVYAYAQTYQTTFENARALLKQKRYTDALQEAERANSIDSSQWGAYFVAGTALVGLEKQQEAIIQFQAALTRAPEQAKPIINQAIAASNQILRSQQDGKGLNAARENASEAARGRGPGAFQVPLVWVSFTGEDWDRAAQSACTSIGRAAWLS